jgi:hypothetical protein
MIMKRKHRNINPKRKRETEDLVKEKSMTTNMNLFKGAAFCSFAMILIATCFSSQASAALIVQPGGLTLGEQYRLAFVTSTWTTATSIDIADYNDFVTNAANAVPELVALNTEWFVIGSTSTVSARENTGTNVPPGLPIFLLDGSKLVDDYGDLWDASIDVPLNRTEIDTVLQIDRTKVFTGTDNGGGIDGLPLGNSPNVTFGYAGFTNNQWIRASNTPASGVAHFYALSAPLTAIPEPATMGLLIIGGLAMLRRKRVGR